MKVLHVDTSTEWRGGQSLLVRLAAGLRDRGVEVEVACPEGSPLAAGLRERGVQVLDVAAGRSLCTAASIARMGKDLVVAHTSHAHDCSLAWGGPLVVHRWVDFPVSGGWKYRRPDGWCAVSGAVGQILEDAGARNVHVVPGGADPLPAAAPAPDAPTVLAVGARVHHKGHDVLAAAARHLPGVDVGVAGAGPLVPLGLRMLGQRDDIPALLRGCRVFVMPSRSEGLGMAAVEALQAGVPVVASDVGGLPEVVGDAGILVPPEDPIALAEGIRRALAGDHPPPDLGRRRVAARYTTDRMVDGALAVYEGVVAALSRPARAATRP
jgi:glycosyltransferase involved in cell wall biosynthesis